MRTELENVLRAAKSNIGKNYKTGTSSHEPALRRGGGQTTVALNATPATSDGVENSGCLVRSSTNSTALDMPKKCTDSHNVNTNLQKLNMKHTSNTTRATLQPYSPAELKEIAENVAEFQRKRVKEYSFTDADGEVQISHSAMWSLDRQRLFLITKNLYELGAHQPKESSRFTLKTIGQTL